jgi:predicted negative regulator of RcsB-dependent stress response
VPLPPLDLVEPPVAEQLRSAEREVEQAAARRANARELTVVGKAVAEAPSSTVARTNLSGVLLQLSEYDAAIEQFEAVPSRC